MRRRALLIPAAVAMLTLVTATIWVSVERARRRDRGREIVAKVADPVRDFVDVVMTAEMAPEAVKALARQPLSVLDDLIEKDPEYGPARAWRGLVYQYLGRGADAAADFDEAWRLAPDFSVVCGPLQFAEKTDDTIVNPTLIGEVLSDSTEAYDRGKKFENYRQMPSLLEYLLVCQKEARIEQFSRQKDGSWVLRDAAGLEATLHLPSLEVTVALSEVFAGVKFAPAPIRPPISTRT